MNAQVNQGVGFADRKGNLIDEGTHQTRVSWLDRSRFSAFGWRNTDGDRRVRSGGAVTALLAIVAVTAVLAGGFLLAQSPPLPQTVELRPVKVVWDPQPASDVLGGGDWGTSAGGDCDWGR